jgi:hypothetical protein
MFFQDGVVVSVAVTMASNAKSAVTVDTNVVLKSLSPKNLVCAMCAECLLV